MGNNTVFKRKKKFYLHRIHGLDSNSNTRQELPRGMLNSMVRKGKMFKHLEQT